ncbi:MAG: amidohydrolase [Erysipelotrichaceae bacterium]|nr:amidohydrolase [Erysipelotrichaceae bacterium]
MKTLIYNGKVYLSEGSFAQAILIEDNIIREVGTDEQFRDCEPDRRIDAGGRLVLPGFNDCHMHLLNYGKCLVRAPLNGCRSVDELIETCRQFIHQHPEYTKTGLSGRGWNQDYFPDKRVPCADDLDRISTQIPVVLTRVCGHMAVANHKAMELADDRNHPDGRFYENDVSVIDEVAVTYSDELLRELLISAMKDAVKAGITSVQSQDVSDILMDGNVIEIFNDVYDKGEGLLRYKLQFGVNSPEDLRKAIDRDMLHFNNESAMLAFGPLKLFKDGSLGARTALMDDGYIDDKDNRGIMIHDRETMDEFVRIANGQGISVLTHCIGDWAADETADSYIACQPEGNPYRNAINHFQITTEAILDKVAENNIPVFYQPIFLEYDLHMVPERVEPELERTSYCYKTALNKGIRIGLSTDCPVESFNPFFNIHCAVNRQDYDLQPEGGYFPDQKLSVAEAVDAYTAGSAYVEFEENRKGRIAEGYLADLIIVKKDIFSCDPEEIMNTEVALTMVDGKVIFSDY